MEVLWREGSASIRQVQEKLPGQKRPAYTTVQTLLYRLEAKGAVRRGRRIGNADIFEPVAARLQTHRRLAEELLSILGGVRPLLSHLVETGKLGPADLQEADRLLKDQSLLK
jgi:predicted transcriptional regulator